MNFKLFNKERDKKILRWVAIAVVVVAGSIIVKDEFLYQIGWYDYDEGVEMEESASSEDCNVAIVDMHGYLFVDADPEYYDEISSWDMVNAIKHVEEDDSIKAVILDINSYGGDPVAGEEVADALRRAVKPTIAVIKQGGASAAYWVATGADVIFASANSDVGSIGVTMSYLDNSLKNQKDGLTYNQLSTGKFKDTGDADKALTYEEKQLFMRDLKITHENFVKAVAENRGLDIEKVRALADGSSMLGEMALENGLIDYIGGLHEAMEYLDTELGEPVVWCW